MVTATWNGKTVASSDDTIFIEGNHYFPAESVDEKFLEKSDHTTVCHWKGESNYYALVDGDERAENAAWYYHTPLPSAEKMVKKDITDYVAFYSNIVTVEKT